MNRDAVQKRLTGCYVAIPTLFHDADLELNLRGMQLSSLFVGRRHSRTQRRAFRPAARPAISQC